MTADELHNQAEAFREEAIFDHFSEKQLGGADGFLKAVQSQIVAEQLIRCAMPEDDELEQMFISAQIDAELENL